MASKAHQYDALFYRYQREGSARSARHVLPVVLGVLPVKSVLDVGCGAAAWLSVYRHLGVQDVVGVDGDYVDRSLLMVDADAFRPQDITLPFDLGRHFDLVQCLEVAEHVPKVASAQLIDNLTRHAKSVLFSAAVPGQGGEDHINEQPLGYWRDLFAARGYRAFDYVRPRILGDAAIEWWYRYNILLYVHESRVSELPQEVLDTEVDRRRAVHDPSPIGLKLAKMVLRMLPPAAVSKLAVLKHQHAVRTMGLSRR